MRYIRLLAEQSAPAKNRGQFCSVFVKIFGVVQFKVTVEKWIFK
jgi:hypothetical protein